MSPRNRAMIAAAALALPTAILAADEPAPGGGAAAVRAGDVLKIFNRRCVECHGVSKQSSRLRLDSIDAVFKGGRSGPAIVAGKSAESEIFKRLTAVDEDDRMPPPDKAEPLAAAEIEAIRGWIESGAKAEESGASRAAAEAAVLKPLELPAGYAPVFSLAGDPAGPRLAAGRGNRVEVIEVPEDGKDGKQPQVIATLEGPADAVQSLAFSPDGKRLAAGEFRTVHIFSAEGWQPLLRLGPHADRVLALVFSPDGKRLAAGGGLPTQTGEIKVWDVETGAEVWSGTPHTDTVLALDWSRDGARLFTGAADRVIYLLDAGTGKPVLRLEGHTHHVLAVSLRPDGKQGVSAGADHQVRFWDLENGASIGDGARGHEREATSVSYFDDGKSAVTTSGDATVRAWNPGNRQQFRAFSEAKGYLQGGCLFQEGKRYAAAEQEGTIRIYDLKAAKLLFTLEAAAAAE